MKESAEDAHRQRLAVSDARRKSALDSSASDHDYAQAGQDLLERVNLRLEGAPERYAPANPIWRDSSTGATLFVGNASIAGDHAALTALSIRRIVFCQDSDGKMVFKGDPHFKYLKFSIGKWRSAKITRPDGKTSQVYNAVQTPDKVINNTDVFGPCLLSFGQVGQGNNCLSI